MNLNSTESGNLFAETPVLLRKPMTRQPPAPELSAARVLCHQLRRKQPRPDKQRLVHLICLNLVAILKQRAQQTSK